MTTYRKLQLHEINELIINKNAADDWDNVWVKDGFRTSSLKGCTLRGEIRIGVIGAQATSPGGVKRQCGIYNAELIDCTIGDNVFISNIGSYIAHYNIGDNVYIESVTLMETTCESAFGNGVQVAAVNEGGGREVPIYNELTAQMAYVIAMYRHRSQCIKHICDMISDRCKSRSSRRGTVSDNVVITGCNWISDVNIGPYAVLRGASVLSNGTINSTKESPVTIGAGVKAHDFILSLGSILDNGAIVRKSFVGEACRIDCGFTAMDSLFFANCDCANGEACSIFAGPYSVSHHKSSLLIAGMFSFFNAGSGANQSNHLFKTGAVHQGVHERGCKFASNAYVMLPSREGAFTVIMGRHSAHHNTENFPYSYLMEEDGRSYLIPAANLRSYGTVRDIAKWRNRDHRGPQRRDLINFDQHNPYLGSKVAKALELSKHMLEKEGVDTYNYERVRIKSVMLRRGVQLYQNSLDATIGAILDKGCNSPTLPEADMHWCDIAGMYAPMGQINIMLDDIQSGALGSIEQIDHRLVEINDCYPCYAYAWALKILGMIINAEPSAQEICQAIERGAKAAAILEAIANEDAKHDADILMKIGYGIDDPSTLEADFAAVRKV